MKPIKDHQLAIVDENDEQTVYKLFRDGAGRVWVTTWEVSRQGRGGFGSMFNSKDFDSAMVKGRSLRVLVEKALGKIDGAGGAASVQRRGKQ